VEEAEATVNAAVAAAVTPLQADLVSLQEALAASRQSADTARAQLIQQADEMAVAR
jgi:hypothetical protein